MPHILSSLEISEVSLVDNPASAGPEIDPRIGRPVARARVALFKRDADTNNKEERKMEFKTILKAAKTRDEIVAAVEDKARKIAKRDGISDDIARAKAWTEHPEAQQAYEAAPKPVAKKAERRMFKATAAEAELDKRARKRMRKSGQSYPQAVSSELNEDPGLYERYQKELAAGAAYMVPEPQFLSTQPDADKFTYKRASSNDDDDDECPECEEDVDEDDKFCANCGTDLSKGGRRAS
jgi:hypothetical protein